MILGFPTTGVCAEAVSTGSDFKIAYIGKQTDYFLDNTQKLSLEEIVSDKYQDAFKSHEKTGFNFGMTSHVVWLRFKIQRSKGLYTDKKILIAIDKPMFPFVSLYIPKGQGGYTEINGGYLNFTKGLTWQYRYPVFKLPQDFAEDQYLFLKVTPATKHIHAAASFNFFLVDEDYFRRQTWFDVMFYFLMFGVLTSMIFYNLFLFTILKDNVYFLYVTYITFILIYLFLRNGFGNLTGLPVITPHTLYAVSIAYIFGVLFSRKFLDLKNHMPVLNKTFWGIIFFTLMVILLSLTGSPKAANQSMHLLAILGPITIFFAGVIRYRQGYQPARYYMAAWFMVLMGTASLSLIGLGVLPKNFITMNGLSIGSTLEAVLLSTALGDRIRILRQEKRALQKKERRLIELSIKDELTGLFNKRWFSSKLLSEIEHNIRIGEPLSLMILDVDNFKRFNDTYGHAAGDRVLSTLGQLIMDNIREHDIPCRYGGEEFAVIFPATEIEKAFLSAERLRKAFQSKRIRLDEGLRANATISIGVGQLSEGEDEDHFFQRVDQALYTAKENGRNQVAKSA